MSGKQPTQDAPRLLRSTPTAYVHPTIIKHKSEHKLLWEAVHPREKIRTAIFVAFNGDKTCHWAAALVKSDEQFHLFIHDPPEVENRGISAKVEQDSLVKEAREDLGKLETVWHTKDYWRGNRTAEQDCYNFVKEVAVDGVLDFEEDWEDLFEESTR